MDIGLINNINDEYVKFGHHVSEVFSPLRVIKEASKVGLSVGWALDLTQINPDDGKHWDFNDASKRNKVIERVNRETPLLLIGCPPCTVFSQIFKMNARKLDPTKLRKNDPGGHFTCKLLHAII